MDQLVVNAVTRTEKGKRVAKKLRENGRLPAVMYNSKGEAIMLDINEVEFTKVWKSATPTTLVNLKLDGKSDNLVFIKDTEYDIKTDRNLHADFHAIDEKKMVKVTMKILLTGNPVGVREGGFLANHQSQVTIQCLPKYLPLRITGDISDLGIGQIFRVKDLGLAKEITILSDPEASLASVSAPRK